jgi:hypothetical protein
MMSGQEDRIMSRYVVITSIHGVTDSVREYAEMKNWHVVLVGDRKTPALDRHPHPNVTFLSVEDQSHLGLASYSRCPLNHYSRKNLGYLYAISQGAEVIADADDDNMPYPSWGGDATFEFPDLEVVSAEKCANIYRWFTDDFVWPRGYPLSAVLDGAGSRTKGGHTLRIAVVQGLVDGDPDVDAIYRLTVGKAVNWRPRGAVALDKGTFCPINSQNTIWAREAFPYLYLPTTVTFRFTDILRGYVAQAGVWSIGATVAFTSPSVFQSRNVHDLKMDFADEIPCYTQVEKLVRLLAPAGLCGNRPAALDTIYGNLQTEGIVRMEEIDGAGAWIDDLRKVGS